MDEKMLKEFGDNKKTKRKRDWFFTIIPCLQGLFIIAIGFLFISKTQEFSPAFIHAKVSGVSPIYVDYTYKDVEYKNIHLIHDGEVEDKQVGDSIDVVIDKKNPSHCKDKGSLIDSNSLMTVCIFGTVGLFLIIVGVFEKYTMRIFGKVYEPYRIIYKTLTHKNEKE
ncbi:MAG: hypothetical protein E7254_12800 [Lachnospiraceae bacterium]|nr:hypothetical protein [Lachnospiraceae bacterium]